MDIGESYHLVLWTYVHAGVPQGDPAFQKLFKQTVWDTCFAILFLRRATRPLEDVPSVDRLHPK